jgi:ABC-type branched-subunit amino acid transport system ATPase component/ABC-type branched-subunit amino acid transport system permease subunit
MTLRGWTGIVLLLGAIAATLMAPNTYYLYKIGLMAITMMVTVGLNILVGLSGQISIGHAGFFAIGAYVASLTMLNLDWSFPAAAGMGIAVTAGMGVALAAPALRVTGPYLAMVTIAFGVIVERVLIEWTGVTGGFGGLSNIPKPVLFGLQPALKDVVLIAVVFAFAAIWSFDQLKQHPWGKAFQAVRDDETAATSLGLNPLTVRVMAFAVSAAFTGLAGAFFASTIGFVSPDSFTFHSSILFLLAVILGGIGTAEGALVGAIALVLLPELIKDFADYQLLVFGVLLLATLWLAPKGLTSPLQRWFDRRSPVYPLDTPPEMPILISRNQTLVALDVEQVGIQFGGVRALNAISLTAQPGTVTAVIGPNGAGKTTLLNLISGFYQTQMGHIRLGETDLTQQSGVAIAREGVGRTFQATRLFDSLSVLDNLRVAANRVQTVTILSALIGRGKAPINPEKELLEVLSFVGFQGDVHQISANLPFVDRRLAEIARALVLGPKLLLLDEPAAGLNKDDKQMLANLVRRIASSGIPVILIEHDMDLVMGISDQVVVLDSGDRICADTPAQVQRNPDVLAAYLGVDSPDLTRSSVPHSQPLLEIRQLVAGYDKLQVLKHIDLTVNAGELVAVIGANGAGKSTLMKSITQLIQPWSGDIIWQNRSLLKTPAHDISQQGIVLVPEGRQVFKELTVIDNLRLGAFNRPTQSEQAIDRDIQIILERFPRLQDRRHQKAGLLSGGEQQMLAIGRGLMARPKLLLLDEPSLGLAPKLVTDLFTILADLRDEGITILLVDQMANLALSIADRAYLLETGQVVQSGTSKELQQNSQVMKAYLGA